MLFNGGWACFGGVHLSASFHNVLSNFTLILLLIAFASAQESEGDWCVTEDGDDGICRLLRYCPEVFSKANVYSGGGVATPGLCSDGPIGTIVCCPVNSKDKPTPATFPPPRPPTSSIPSLGSLGENADASTPIRIANRMSEQKCLEYSKMIDESRRRFGELGSLSRSERCPYPGSANELIVGGQLSAAGQYPHMAALGYLRSNGLVEWLCGGSLISESYVLTAAHCASSRFGRMIVVRLGKLSLETEPFSKIRQSVGSGPGILGDYAVAEIIRHKDHNFTSLYNDIALIRLAQPVKEFNNFIRPACLNSQVDVEGKATAVGWGYTEFGGGPTDDNEQLLRHVTLTIHDNEYCNTLYKAETIRSSFSEGVVDSMVCAGELAGGKDSCQGDSGGPLQVRHPNDPCLHSVIGVISFGKFCGPANGLGIYTRVSYYLPWIESIVWTQ